MEQNNKDLADLLNIFTGRYYEFVGFIESRCADDNERATWKERLDQMIDLSRVVGIFSPENQELAKSKIEDKAVKKTVKIGEEEYDPFL